MKPRMTTARQWANEQGVPISVAEAIQRDALGTVRYMLITDPTIGPSHPVVAAITELMPHIEGAMDETGAILRPDTEKPPKP